jgi:acetyltransferase-like isoleucine patch superfamily enzyme
MIKFNLHKNLWYIKRICNYVNTIIVKAEFKQFGKRSRILSGEFIAGGKYIVIGEHTIINKSVILTAHFVKDYNESQKIVIGNNCNIGIYNHITAINQIMIGNGVLTGPNVLITDNSHGQFTRNQLDTPPNERPLFSSGKVVI